MKVGYLDCFSGISGDMLMGALADAGASTKGMQDAVAGLGVAGLRLDFERVVKSGISALKAEVAVETDETPPHRLPQVLELIERSELGPAEKATAASVFRALAHAEARVHGTDVENVHFHEVGAFDAVADVVGTVAGFADLRLDMLWCSAVPAPCGETSTEHGTLPLPAPAALELLRGFEIRPTTCRRELVTPTGAALARTLSDPSDGWPCMTVERIGYGAGAMDLEHANVLRLVLGTAPDPAAEGYSGPPLVMVETNVDDMNPEWIAHLESKLLGLGALDLAVDQVLMKKGRPGLRLSVLVDEASLAGVAEALFRETTTLGVRFHRVGRLTLRREVKRVETGFGTVDVKVGYLDGEPVNAAPEYESCRKVAEEAGVPLKQVYREALARCRDAAS